MKITTILKFVLPVIFSFGLVGSGYYLLLLVELNNNKKDTPVNVATESSFGWKFPITKFPQTGPDGKQIAYSDIRDPGGIAQGLPVRLKIPVINVDSAIEDAYITPDGRMDVPAGSVNVAWFSLGPHPGQVGSAVIGGHFGIENGVPFVFYNLDKLKKGDKIYIIDDKDDTLAFVVKDIKLFDRNADATTVFTSQDGKAHLNLITCEGLWNQSNGTYPDRRVVFADAIPAESVEVVHTPTPIPLKDAPPNATGGVAQQTKQMPTPIPTEKFIAPSSEKKSGTLPSVIIASAQSLYATPIDAFITLILLLSIGLITFKIIKR